MHSGWVLFRVVVTGAQWLGQVQSGWVRCIVVWSYLGKKKRAPVDQLSLLNSIFFLCRPTTRKRRPRESWRGPQHEGSSVGFRICRRWPGRKRSRKRNEGLALFRNEKNEGLALFRNEKNEDLVQLRNVNKTERYTRKEDYKHCIAPRSSHQITTHHIVLRYATLYTLRKVTLRYVTICYAIYANELHKYYINIILIGAYFQWKCLYGFVWMRETHQIEPAWPGQLTCGRKHMIVFSTWNWNSSSWSWRVVVARGRVAWSWRVV